MLSEKNKIHKLTASTTINMPRQENIKNEASASQKRKNDAISLIVAHKLEVVHNTFNLAWTIQVLNKNENKHVGNALVKDRQIMSKTIQSQLKYA